jgi:replicative DNA helicase
MLNLVARYRKQLDEKIQRAENKEYNVIPTGYPSLDEKMIGWTSQTLSLIGARPSMGKTAIVLDLMLKAQEYAPVLFLSLEMGVNALINRYIMRDADFNRKILHTGEIDVQNRNRIDSILDDLQKKNIFIDDFTINGTDKHIKSVSSKITKFVRNHNVKIVFIDYLGLVQHSAENSNKGLGGITKALTALKKELDIHICLLHQLNRSVESRADKRPLLSDLRDSGEIEEDLDIAMFLYRENYYNQIEMDFEDDPKIEIIFRKNRDGELGTVELTHNYNLTRFIDPKNTNEMPF